MATSQTLVPDQQPLVYKAGDTFPPIMEDLEQRDPDTGLWGPLDLEGKMVRLLAQETRTKRRFGGVAEQVVGVPGRVAYTPLPTDLVVGDYRYSWEVSTPDGQLSHVPRDRYRELTVIAGW